VGRERTATAFIFLIALDIMLCSRAQAAPYVAYDQKWDSQICVKNYEIGAVLTEEYSKAERLEGATTVRSFSNSSGCSSEGILEAGMRSDATGNLHSVWESVDNFHKATGRHSLLSRDIEDLTGIFSIDRFIRLLPSSTNGSISIDWLPCV
jgi:hypothetical protein